MVSRLRKRSTDTGKINVGIANVGKPERGPENKVGRRKKKWLDCIIE